MLIVEKTFQTRYQKTLLLKLETRVFYNVQKSLLKKSGPFKI